MIPHCLRHALFLRIRGIGINLLSEFSGGVAKLFLNGYRVGARRKGNGSVVVPSIVKADSCNACLGYQLFEIVVDRLVYQVPAGFIGEDQPGNSPSSHTLPAWRRWVSWSSRSCFNASIAGGIR